MFCATRVQSAPRHFANLAALTLTLILGFAYCFGKTDELDHFRIRIDKSVKITASYNYCWFPTVHRFLSGEILAMMRMSPDDSNPEGEFSAYCVSRDGGKTWSRRFTMGAGANIDAAYSQDPLDDAIWGLGSGYLSLEPQPNGQGQDFYATLTSFSRGGMEVNQARDARIHLAEAAQLKPVKAFGTQKKDASQLASLPSAVPYGAIISGPRGEWLSTLYYTTKRDRRFNRLVLIRSLDHGHTWVEDGVIAGVQPDDKPWPWMGSEGPNEAGIVRLPDGRLFSVFRTGNHGDMGETWSSDDGKTWSAPTTTGLKGVAPHLRLLTNGLLICTFGRPGVTMMFSQNAGKSWAGITQVFKGPGTGYSDVVEIAPGKLFVIYDSLSKDGGNPVPGNHSENAIYGAFVEIQKR